MLPTSAIICASCLFQIGDGDVLGEIKGPPNLMPALRRQIVAEASPGDFLNLDQKVARDFIAASELVAGAAQ